VVGLVEDVPTVAALVSRMVADAEATITGRLAGMLSGHDGHGGGDQGQGSSGIGALRARL